MNRTRILPIFLLLLGAAACAVDGGQRGTGATSAEGNIARVESDGGAIAGIRVALADDNVATETDAQGRFSLRGQFEGETVVLFERAGDSLSAHLEVNIPAGGTLTLHNIDISVSSSEARPESLEVVFEGRVVALDCAGGRVTLASTQRDPAETDTYVLVLQSSTLNDRQHQPRTCTDLRHDDRLAIDGFFADDGTIGNADAVVE